RRVSAQLATRVRERPVKTRVGQAREAVADLVARAAELLGGEAGGRLAARLVDRLAQQPLVVARGAGGEDRDGPVLALLDGGAQIVAEPETLADLLEEARVGIGPDDLDRHRE